MCRERKNKSFIPTWAIGWRQNFPQKSQKISLAFQRGGGPRGGGWDQGKGDVEPGGGEGGKEGDRV